MSILVLPASQTFSTYVKLVIAVLKQRFIMWAQGKVMFRATNAVSRYDKGILVYSLDKGLFVYRKILAPDDRSAVTIVYTDLGISEEVTVEEDSYVVVNGQVINVNFTDILYVYADNYIPSMLGYVPFCTARVQEFEDLGLAVINNQTNKYEVLINTPASTF